MYLLAFAVAFTALIYIAAVGILLVAFLCFMSMLCFLALCIGIAGTIGDYFYDKKMLRGKAPYRLPWYYRWKGWRLGHDPDNSLEWKNGMAFDKRTKKFICITRPSDRAVGRRYGL